MPIPLHWHTEPLLLLLIIGVGWAYALAIGPMREKISPGTPLEKGKAAAFLLALAIAYLTVGSPLDQLGEDFLFCAHMVQHMLLVYAIPPLLLWGTPVWLADWLLRPAGVRKVWRILCNPVFAGLFFTFLYTLWHIPMLYEAALQKKWIHILEHWTMFLPALWMWWPILGPSKRIPPMAYGLRMLYIFVLMVGQLPVFAFLTLSDEVLYPTYAYAARITELSPLQDQILGGVVMKVSNMVVSITVLSISFYCWWQAEERMGEAEKG